MSDFKRKNVFYLIKEGKYIIADLECVSKSERCIDFDFNNLAIDFDILDLLNLAYITKASEDEKIEFFKHYLISFQDTTEFEYKERTEWLNTNPKIRLLITDEHLLIKIKDLL